MNASITDPIVLAAVSMLTIAAALAWSVRRGQWPESARWRLALTALPGLLALATFYSLAIHMHARLGGWPARNGMEGFPPELVTHAEVSQHVFAVAALVALGMPLVLGLFATAPRLRARMIYPACCGAASWLCLLLTALAPWGFRSWWWD